MAIKDEFSTVKKLLATQILIAIIVASGFLLKGGWQMAMSPAVGGLVALLPNAYLAYRVYRSRHLEAKQILTVFYASESVKIVLTAVLFVLVLQLPGIDLLTLLVGYLAVLSVFWFALILWRE